MLVSSFLRLFMAFLSCLVMVGTMGLGLFVNLVRTSLTLAQYCLQSVFPKRMFSPSESQMCLVVVM